MDNYIQVLSYLHMTQRYKDIFENNENIGIRFILPTEDQIDNAFDKPVLKELNVSQSVNVAAIFLHGCYLCKEKDYKTAAKSFKRILKLTSDQRLKSKAKSLEYEAMFNLGACLFKAGEEKHALKYFTTLQ